MLFQLYDRFPTPRGADPPRLSTLCATQLEAYLVVRLLPLLSPPHVILFYQSRLSLPLRFSWLVSQSVLAAASPCAFVFFFDDESLR